MHVECGKCHQLIHFAAEHCEFCNALQINNSCLYKNIRRSGLRWLWIICLSCIELLLTAALTFAVVFGSSNLLASRSNMSEAFTTNFVLTLIAQLIIGLGVWLTGVFLINSIPGHRSLEDAEKRPTVANEITKVRFNRWFNGLKVNFPFTLLLYFELSYINLFRVLFLGLTWYLLPTGNTLGLQLIHEIMATLLHIAIIPIAVLALLIDFSQIKRYSKNMPLPSAKFDLSSVFILLALIPSIVVYAIPVYHIGHRLAFDLLGNPKDRLEYTIASHGNISRFSPSRELANVKDKKGITFLMAACRRGDLNLVQALIDQGADVNAVDNRGETALHYTVLYANKFREEIIETLLQGKANPNVTSLDCMSPLSLSAGQQKNLVIAKLLLAAGASVRIERKGCDSQQALIRALGGRNLELARIFLNSKKIDINAIHKQQYSTVYDQYQSPLSAAVRGRNGNGEAVELVIKHGANVNAQNPEGETALMQAAAQMDSQEIVKALLKAGAKVDIRAKNGKTALSEAKRTKESANVSILLEHEAK